MGCLLGLTTGSLWADAWGVHDDSEPMIGTSATTTSSVSLGDLVFIDPSIVALPDDTVLTAAQVALLPSSFVNPKLINNNVPTLQKTYTYKISKNNSIEVTETAGNQMSSTTMSKNYQFANNTYPDLYASLASHPTTKTLSETEIVMLPESWQERINAIVNAHPGDPKFSYSVKYTNTNTVTSFKMFQGWVTTTTIVPTYTFTMSYTYSINNLDLTFGDNNSSTGFGNVTGGPPVAVYFGATFPVNITMQAYGCNNSYYELWGTTSTAFNHRSHFFDGMVRDPTSGHNHDYSDYIDVCFGNFVAPQKTDQKTTKTLVYKTNRFGIRYDYQTITTTTTFGDSPVLEVDTSLTLADHGDKENGGIKQTATLDGYWNVNLVDAPANAHTVPIAVKVTPKGGYQYWIKGISKQIDVKVQ